MLRALATLSLPVTLFILVQSPHLPSHAAESVTFQDVYGPTGGHGCEDLISRELQKLGGGSFSKPKGSKFVHENEWEAYKLELSKLPPIKSSGNADDDNSARTAKRDNQILDQLDSIKSRFRMDDGKRILAEKIGGYDKAVVFETKDARLEALYNEGRMVAFHLKQGDIAFTNELSHDCKIKRIIREKSSKVEGGGRYSNYSYVDPQYCRKIPEIKSLLAEIDSAEHTNKDPERLKLAKSKLKETVEKIGSHAPFHQAEFNAQVESCSRFGRDLADFSTSWPKRSGKKTDRTTR